MAMKQTITIILVFLALSVFGHSQTPKVLTVGTETPECLDAAYKVAYTEGLVSSLPGHKTFVACSTDVYKHILSERGFTYEQAPDGLSEPKVMATFLDASAVLRADSGTINHDGHYGVYNNFGQFLIAHEIAHLAASARTEWQADVWAAEALKKHVKVSYEQAGHPHSDTASK